MSNKIYPLNKQIFYNNYPISPSKVNLLDKIYKPAKHRKKYINSSRCLFYPCVFCCSDELGSAEHNADCPVRDNRYLITDENRLIGRYYSNLKLLEKGYKTYAKRYYSRWQKWAKRTKGDRNMKGD